VRWGTDGEEKMVKVYSNCDEAELFVNGKSLGIKKRNSQDFPAAGLRWLVPMQKGNYNIKVVAKKGKVTVTDEVTQAYQTEKWGKPAKLVLQKVSEADGLTTVEVKAYDANNVLCLDAATEVRFNLLGDGELIKNQGTSAAAAKVQLYNGRAVISLRTNNQKNVVSVSSTGLSTTFLTIEK